MTSIFVLKTKKPNTKLKWEIQQLMGSVRIQQAARIFCRNPTLKVTTQGNKMSPPNTGQNTIHLFLRR